MDPRSFAPARAPASPTTDSQGTGEAAIRGPNGRLLIPASALAQKLGISTRTLRRLELQGKVPPPLRIGRSVRWSLSLIDQWLDAGAPTPDTGARRSGRTSGAARVASNRSPRR